MARPRNLRRGRYRMTPARRAALRKAQLASARKRRRVQIAKGVGKAALNVGGLFVAARVSSYIVRPSKISKDFNSVKTLGKNSYRRLFVKNSTPQTIKTYQNGPWV